MLNKILLTGGAGLIGKSLASELLKNNYKVSILDLPKQVSRNKKFFKSNPSIRVFRGSITNSKVCVNAAKNIDCIIHLAAMLGVKNTDNNQNGCIKINVEGTENILKASIKNKIKRFIFISSSEVYGEPKKNPIKETDKLYGKSIYAISKLIGEKLVKKYCDKNKKMKFNILRLFNTYGEGQVAQFVIAKFIKDSKKNREIIINGNGNQIRSYAYSNDVAMGIQKLLLSKNTLNKTYNLGNSNEVISLKQLAKKIRYLSKTKIKIKILNNFNNSDRDKTRETYKRHCSTIKAKKDFGYNPKTKLITGLQRMYNQKIIYNFWP